MPRAKNPGRRQPAPALTQTEADIAFWLELAKEFVNGNDEGDAGIIRYALEFTVLSYVQAQMSMDPKRH